MTVDDRPTRRLVVLGATGGTGKLVVEQALELGHHVTAVVRTPAKLGIEHDRLDTVQGDVTDADTLRPLLRDADAVVSVLGSICEAAITAVLEGFDDPAGRRIVAVSAQPVDRDDSGQGLLTRLVLLPMVRRVFRTEYADLARMEEVLQASNANWTVIRPPYLQDKPAQGTYRLALESKPPRSGSITRADLARALLDAVDDSQTHRHAAGVSAA